MGMVSARREGGRGKRMGLGSSRNSGLEAHREVTLGQDLKEPSPGGVRLGGCSFEDRSPSPTHRRAPRAGDRTAGSTEGWRGTGQGWRHQDVHPCKGSCPPHTPSSHLCGL